MARQVFKKGLLGKANGALADRQKRLDRAMNRSMNEAPKNAPKQAKRKRMSLKEILGE